MSTTKIMLRSVGFAIALVASTLAGNAQDIAVHAKILHTAEGPPIRDAIVVIQRGKIVTIGPIAAVTIPAGMKTLTVEVATPGLVDAHSVVGLAGAMNQPQDQDQHDPTAPIQPELRAIDAYNARERLIEWVRGFGVTTIHTGHAPLALISGQTLVAKTRGDTVDEAVIVPRAMIAATLGADSRAEGEGKSPGTAGKQLALLREALVGAQEYRKKLAAAGSDAAKRPDRDLRKETLADVLDGKIPLLVTAHRHQDISSALRLQQEFGFKLVLDGASESYTLLEQLREAKVPVILHPPMARFSSEMENASRATPAQMREKGILFALQSGYESYVPKTRVVLYEAAIAAAHGLGADAALRSITIDAARILGLEARLGSLAVGKDGDLALYDGDPFEYTTHCVGTVIEGVVVFDGRR